MDRKYIVKRIGYLQDTHDSGRCRVKRCQVCNEIRELGKMLEYTQKTLDILAKGQDMKKSEVIFLKVEKEIPFGIIAKALGVTEASFKNLCYREWGCGKRKRKVDPALLEEIKTSKRIHTSLTVETYKALKNQGWSDTEIKEQYKISNGSFWKWKKQNLTNEELEKFVLPKGGPGKRRKLEEAL
ncbi:hypothetical protein [Bacillus sp. FJAT-49736]|uniref:hypothetical protein n=1 Tax=Bacillus sp. FJAT-49736 TaxID=2833582 RepID=UPI001BCA2430|nr:hypothetical protein [Bacillus sp. FJAT-49736]MBS4173491.1 hypothetical protein [Bacillus sp. FJAT-49736]